MGTALDALEEALQDRLAEGDPYEVVVDAVVHRLT